jgi:O-antigen/teichoic acid export membrane protein
MSTVQRIARNTGLLFISQILIYALGFFSMAYMARYLGAANYGIISFALAFTAIFAILADIGLSYLMMREVTRDKSLASKYILNISVMKIVLVTVTFGLIALTVNLMGYPQQTINVVYVIGLYVIFNSFNGMFYSIFQAHERMEYLSIAQVLNAALILAGIILAIKHNYSIAGFGWIYFLATAATLVYSLVITRWKFPDSLLWPPRKTDWDWGFCKQIIKQAWPFALTSVFATIYYYISTVMLSKMEGDETVGWYNAAFRLMLLPLFVPTVFNTAIFPVMAQFSISSKASLEFTYQRYFKYMLLLGIPIGVGTTLVSDQFIVLIFGKGYEPAVITLQILIWSVVFIFMGSVFGRLIESLNKQVIATIYCGIGAALNVVLNLLLIPRYSYTGAAASMVATEFAVLFLAAIFCFRLGYGISLKGIAKDGGKAILASLLMGGFVWYFKGFNRIIPLIILAVLIYFLFIWLFKFFDRDDINIFKQILGSFRKQNNLREQ